MATTSFRPEYISFDCYGTLINYQTEAATRPLLAGRLAEGQMSAFMRDWRQFRYDQVCGDFYPYEQVLQDAWNRVCRKWNIESTEDAGKRFGAAVRSCGAHDGVVDPLKKMGENYKQVILSNAD